MGAADAIIDAHMHKFMCAYAHPYGWHTHTHTGSQATGNCYGAVHAGRKTLEAVGAADAIVDALDVAANEVDRLQVSRVIYAAAGVLCGVSGWGMSQAAVPGCCENE